VQWSLKVSLCSPTGHLVARHISRRLGKRSLYTLQYKVAMTDLNQALIDIRSIRRQVANATEFRGYGPLTLTATAVLALLGGVAQHLLLPEPAIHPVQYVSIWLTTGILSAALIVTQMFTRADRLHSGMADEMIRIAVAQFLPAGIAGSFCRLSCYT
jgi:fumarate reductase subunit D